jgi:hypothetical protein
MVGGPAGAAIASAGATVATGGNRNDILRGAALSGFGAAAGGPLGTVSSTVVGNPSINGVVLSSFGAAVGNTGEGRKIVPGMMGLAGGVSGGALNAMLNRGLGDVLSGRTRADILRNAAFTGIGHQASHLVGMDMAKNLNLLGNGGVSGKVLSGVLRTAVAVSPQKVGLPLMAAAGGVLRGPIGAGTGAFLGGIMQGDNLKKAGMRAVTAGGAHLVGEALGSKLGLKFGSGTGRLITSVALGGLAKVLGSAAGSMAPKYATLVASAAGGYLHGPVGAALGGALGSAASGHNRRTILANAVAGASGAALGKSPFAQMVGAAAGTYMAHMAQKTLEKQDKSQKQMSDDNLKALESEELKDPLAKKATTTVENAFKKKGYGSIYTGTGLEDKNARFEWSPVDYKKLRRIIEESRSRII